MVVATPISALRSVYSNSSRRSASILRPEMPSSSRDETGAGFLDTELELVEEGGLLANGSRTGFELPCKFEFNVACDVDGKLLRLMQSRISYFSEGLVDEQQKA